MINTRPVCVAGNVRNLSIVMPVFGGLDIVHLLFDSLAETISMSRFGYFGELIVVNGNPTDLEISSYLQNAICVVTSASLVTCQPENLGLVCSINAGIEQANSNNDVLILNSDIITYHGLVDNLFLATMALNRNNINWASVTPFSNGATIAAIPEIDRTYDEFENQNRPEIVSRLCEKLFDASEPPLQMPVGIGGCMLMNRDAINAVGVFSEMFSRGCGEDVDWCLRASKLGFKHFLTPRVFVYRHGSGDLLGVTSANIERGNRILSKLYPHYDNEIRSFLNKSKNLRFHNSTVPFITFLRLLKNKNVIVHIVDRDIYQSTEGSDKFTEDICSYLLRAHEISSVLVYPDYAENWKSYGVLIDGKYFSRLSLESIALLLEVLIEVNAITTRALVLQHVANWDLDELLIIMSKIPLLCEVRKIAVISDNDFLLDGNGPIIEEEELSNAEGKIEDASISSDSNKLLFKLDMEKSCELLNSCEVLLLPSQEVSEHFLSMFPTLMNKTTVVSSPIPDNVGAISQIFLNQSKATLNSRVRCSSLEDHSHL